MSERIPDTTWKPPTVMPPQWSIHSRSADGARYVSLSKKLVVILSVAIESDGRRWLHLSCSHRRRKPTWHELREVKDLFIGRNAYAYQVLPPDDYYVNLNPDVLHLFHCLDGHKPPLPEFSGVVNGVRTL